MRSSCTEDRRQSGAPDYSPLSALLTCIRINMKNVNNTTMCFQNRFQSHSGSENTWLRCLLILPFTRQGDRGVDGSRGLINPALEPPRAYHFNLWPESHAADRSLG